VFTPNNSLIYFLPLSDLFFTAPRFVQQPVNVLVPKLN
jgi:hypothetical protein